MCKHFLFVAVVFIVGTLCAQQSDFSLRNYTAIDGLPQSQVNAIVEDKNGYLWMATTGGGLARFDGKDFKVYTTLDGLLSNTIYDLKIDNDQNLWIVHPRGLSRFNGIAFKKFQAPGQLSNLKMVRRAHIFKDTVFIVSAPGVLGKIYKDSVYYWNREIGNNISINRVHPMPDGNLIFFLSDGQVILKTAKGDRQVGNISNGKIFSLYNRGDELVVSIYALTDKSVQSYSMGPSDEKLKRDSSTFQQQVLFFDTQTKAYWLKNEQRLLVKRFDESKLDIVLEDIEATQVYPDREGNVWIATNGNGLYKYYNQDFTRCSSENMRGVMAILKDKDQFTWVGTMNKGLWKIKDGKAASYPNKESFRNMVNCLAETPDGTVWIGTSGGLGKYDKKKDQIAWYTPEDGLSGYSIINISPDEKGNLWVGTSMGLSYFDGKAFKKYSTEQGLLANMVNSTFYFPKSKTLFVGNEFGVNAISNQQVSQLPIKGFDNTAILSIHSYQDSLILIGSGGAGFAVYNPQNQLTKFISTRDGLLSDFIYFIAADDDQYIWVGTEKGISRLLLNTDLEIIQNLHFDHDNGLRGVETNQNAFSFNHSEKLFGLVDGIYQFNGIGAKAHSSFDLHLTGVDIFYGDDPARQYADSLFGLYKLPYQPVFPSDKNHITFSFNRVDKRYPKSVRFKYFLNNFDKAWSQPSSSKQVTYSNLPPGEYEFQLMATDNQGAWSPVKLRYPFVIKAPFYQTAGFIFMSIVVFICLVMLFFYWRIRLRVERAMLLATIREQEQENLRKEIARDFHDEMGNQLTRIINYVSLLKLNGSVINPAGNGSSNRIDLYTKVEDSAKYLYTGTRDFIWSIDPVNDELSKLFLYIRDFGEKLFEEKDISFRAFNGVKGKVKLPYGFSRQANLIFKEVMTNAFKSAQAKNATFSLHPTESGFEFRFEDDGVGFNVETIGKSNGLKNIRERADKLRADLRIQSGPGAGTTITLNFKINKNQYQYGTTI